VAIQPKGKSQWSVVEEDQKEAISQRGKTEGVIGTLKSKRCDFNGGRQRTNETLKAAGSTLNVRNELDELVARLGWKIETSNPTQSVKENRANEMNRRR
jgi:hypothetical protein